MKQHILPVIYIALLSSCSAIHAYQVSASNFYSPRPKTLRRIAKNLSLAIAIDKIHTHPLLNPEQADLLRAFPTFRSNFFIKTSTIKTKNGTTYAVPELMVGIKKLEETMRAIQQDASYTYKAQVDKVLSALQEFLVEMEKIGD